MCDLWPMLNLRKLLELGLVHLPETYLLERFGRRWQSEEDTLECCQKFSSVFEREKIEVQPPTLSLSHYAADYTNWCEHNEKADRKRENQIKLKFSY